MKEKEKNYYVKIGNKRILVRKSFNDYKYALIFKDTKVWSCSNKKELLEQKIKYYTKGYGYKFDEKVNGKYLYSSQFYNPVDFKIVTLESD